MILANLKTMRLNRALSMRDLTERSGVTATTIVRAEKGLDVYPTTVRKLAKALGVSPSELRGDASNETLNIQQNIPPTVAISERKAVLVANMLDQAERARARGDDAGAAQFERMAAKAAVAEA